MLFRTKVKQKQPNMMPLEGQMPKPFKQCVVDGCKSKTSSRSVIAQVYVGS